jgi:hypothetical protein
VADFYDPFSGAREVERQFGDKEGELVSAFLRSCQQRTNPEFAKSLRTWIKWRVDAELAVDPEDSQATEPSEDFKATLRQAFNERFNKASVAPKKAVKKRS